MYYYNLVRRSLRKIKLKIKTGGHQEFQTWLKCLNEGRLTNIRRRHFDKVPTTLDIKLSVI